VLTGCPSDSEEGEGGLLDGWQGEEPHFVVKGFLDGEDLDFAIKGDESGATVWCEREYRAPLVDGEPDLARAEHVETTIAGTVTIDGEERGFEFELLNHGLNNDEAGTDHTIVPRVDGEEIDEHDLWAEWEWSTIDGDTSYEAAAQEGTFVLKLVSGEPTEDNAVIPDGEGFVGGFVEARWSVDERLTISFNVLCTEHEVEAL
jgi:hypothetical protein